MTEELSFAQERNSPILNDRRMTELTTDSVGSLKIAPSPSAVRPMVLDESGSVPTWEEASYRLKARLSATEKTNRFMAPWAFRTQGRIMKADEQVRKFVRSTALITLTGNPLLPGNGSYIPPTSFLTALTRSRGPRREELRKELNKLTGRWITVRVLGAHDSGYPHTHLAVCADVDLAQSDLVSMVEQHVDSSPVAQADAHEPDKAVRVESDVNSEPVGAIGYVGTQIPGMLSVLQSEETTTQPCGVIDEETHRVRTAAILEATKTEVVRIDSGPAVDPGWY